MSKKNILDSKKADKHQHKSSFGKDMLMLFGAGLTAGLVLLGAADKICNKIFDHYEDDVEFKD